MTNAMTNDHDQIDHDHQTWGQAFFFTQKSLPDPSVEASGDPLEFLKTPKTLR